MSDPQGAGGVGPPSTPVEITSIGAVDADSSRRDIDVDYLCAEVSKSHSGFPSKWQWLVHLIPQALCWVGVQGLLMNT